MPWQDEAGLNGCLEGLHVVIRMGLKALPEQSWIGSACIRRDRHSWVTWATKHTLIATNNSNFSHTRWHHDRPLPLPPATEEKTIPLLVCTPLHRVPPHPHYSRPLLRQPPSTAFSPMQQERPFSHSQNKNTLLCLPPRVLPR
jgi:hypothetical protein